MIPITTTPTTNFCDTLSQLNRDAKEMGAHHVRMTLAGLSNGVPTWGEPFVDFQVVSNSKDILLSNRHIEEIRDKPLLPALKQAIIAELEAFIELQFNEVPVGLRVEVKIDNEWVILSEFRGCLI